MTPTDIAKAKCSRRCFLTAALSGAAALPVRGALGSRLRIGTMDTVLTLAGKAEAITFAKQLGLAAVQVTLGVSVDGKTLRLEDAQLQERYVSVSRQQSIPIDSTYIDMLHVSCLKSDFSASKWVLKGIEMHEKSALAHLDACVLR
jgi:hypothetical protein